ncbi:MAG: methyltransferase [Candidatus Nanoarchaeia archaeon]|nr:methyltransferase [Candidatus Nanoarchaeia archaeon]MDD5239638.1 methyltransferase [Candidatus Nanoarchaeia archaeon]
MKLNRHEHYFSPCPICKRKEYEFRANVLGIPLDFITASGIFSPREIDRGSLILVENMELRRNSKVLDLGCGYGFIGIMAAKLCPSCHVTMVDINERAVWAAKINLKRNLVGNASAKQSFMFSTLKDEMFDIILLNPPMAAGLDICYEMIQKSFEHLKLDGLFQIVARNNKGGSRLSDKMSAIFGNVEVLAKEAGFWVYKSIKTNNSLL